MTISSILKKHDKSVIIKFKDFLLSEVGDDDDVDIITDFIMSDDETKFDKYSDMIYSSLEYDGVFLDGNQYIISSDNKIVHIVDIMASKYDKNSIVELCFDIDDFLFLIHRKDDFIKHIDNY